MSAATKSERVVIGTRGSQLALRQTELVRSALQERYPDLSVELLVITTRGDRVLDRPLAAIGSKGLFVEEIEVALREGQIDLAVHSAKDLPSEPPAGLVVTTCLARADARDVLVTNGGSLDDLPAGARVGTSSVRRASQLRAHRADLVIESIRGNVDTRVRKLRAGQVEALILAGAGLLRLNLESVIAEWLPQSWMLSAAGQGALAVEYRADDARLAGLLAPLVDGPTQLAVMTERAFLAAAGGGCSAAVAVNVSSDSSQIRLEALIGAPDGRAVRDSRQGPIAAAGALAASLAADLLARGGAELLRAGASEADDE